MRRIVLSFLFAFLGFMMQVAPDDAVSNLSKWISLLSDAQLPVWMLSRKIDTYGTWLCATLALVTFVWFLYGEYPVIASILGRSGSTTWPRPGIDRPQTARPRIEIIVRRRNRSWHHFKTRCLLARRAIIRYWRLIGPWDYEAPRAIYDTIGRYYSDLSDDRITFFHRFGDAFPGTRDLLVIKSSPLEIISRLNVLLRWPVISIAAVGTDSESVACPFYWNNGDGNMHIERYCHYKRDVVLINEMEIKPTYLAAIGGDIYWRTFVYLEVESLPRRSIRGEEGHVGPYQEYAIYDGRVFNRGEYDDGSYIEKGRPVRFKRRPDLRCRHLVPMGMILIPNSSPANNPKRDQEIRSHIQAVIEDKSNIDDFAKYLLSLPKERRG